MNLCGIQIIESMQAIETIEVERTWKERLFSWPWRPWVANKAEHRPAIYRMTLPPIGYSPNAIKLMQTLEGETMLQGKEVILIHPVKMAELRASGAFS